MRRTRTHWTERLESRRLLASATTGVLPIVSDVGPVGASGTFVYSAGTYSLTGSGLDIGGTTDGFTFAFAPEVQDAAVSARVATLSAASSGALSGVMIRDPAGGAGAAMATLGITHGQQLKFIYRTVTNTTATSVVLPGFTGATFVRLTRAGTRVTPSYSLDGSTWTSAAAPIDLTFSSGASQVGLIVLSRNTAQTNTSTFTNVAAVGNDADWLYTHVGTTTVGGSFGENPTATTFDLLSSGAGFSNNADDVDLATRPLVGDGDVIARVVAIDPSTIAGVTLRADASAGAPFAATTTGDAQLAFTWRDTAGGVINRAAISLSLTAPVSLKVVRDGDHFGGFYSADAGVTWQPLGDAVTIAMPTTTLAGLVAAKVGGSNAVVDATFGAVDIGSTTLPGAGVLNPADELFLNDLESRTVQWFAGTQNATSGLFPDRANAAPGWLGGVSSAAATGFGLTALVIGASRGMITDAYTRAFRTLSFLYTDADMANPANHGFFYHFVDPTTGARDGTSELSSIDTALLIAGVMTAGQYWKGTEVETLATQIANRVDWTFMQPDGAGTELRMAWTPEHGFTSARWSDWSEGPLVYLLAIGSPTHPVAASSWASFSRSAFVTTYAGLTFYHTANAPLFTNQYPQAWFDLRGLSDRVDADPSPTHADFIDPIVNARNHTLAQRQALIDAANGPDPKYDSYGPNVWGLTASDSASGYQVFGGPPLTANVDGTLAPTAAGGSLAFTPRQSIDCLVNLATAYPNSYRGWGFVDAFNPRPGATWYDNDALGIDQGMMLVAAENLRGGLPWRTFMSDAAAQSAVSLAFGPNADFALPAVASSSFAFETAQRLTVRFNADVSTTLNGSDVQLVNVTTGQSVPASNWTLATQTTGGTTTATFAFTSILPDGRYELRVAAGGIARPDGTTNLQQLDVPFFVLAGDANRDGAVTFDDLLALARNYGRTGLTFSGGNFDYSADGAVNFSDLLILARVYGTQLPAAPAAASAAVDAATPRRRHAAADLSADPYFG